MAETSVGRESSGGDRPNRAKRSQSPSPPMGPRDLISDLPDALIHHIFSFLPLRDVVKTSTLSKRWQSTWTTTAHLVFDDVRPRNPDDTYTPDCSHDARFSDLLSVFDSVLSRCTSPTVKRFHIINFNCDEPKLDLWLRFAEERRVEDLRLHLDAQPECFYKLPRFLYCSSRLVRLEAWSCCLSLGTAIRWPCLKVLSIRFAEMSDDILEGIVRGSPVLESLELDCCRGVKNILIDSTSVKELILAEGRFSNLEKIRAPHLLSLQVSGILGLHSVCRLDDISSLVEVKLDFLVCGENGKGHDLFKELLEKTRGVSTITIGCWFLQILFFWEMEVVASPLSKCQNLILHAPIDRWTLPGIAYMLQSEQCLEKFVINLTGYELSTFELDKKSIKCYNFDEDLLSWKRNFQCLAKHLKRVEIIGFAYPFWSKHLLALIKFLLGDALALEKMIIKVDLHAQRGQKRLEAADLSELLGVCREVLRYRRASQNAEVIFNYPLEEVSFESLKSI